MNSGFEDIVAVVAVVGFGLIVSWFWLKSLIEHAIKSYFQKKEEFQLKSLRGGK